MDNEEDEDSYGFESEGGCGDPFCTGCGMYGRRRGYGGFPYDSDDSDGLGAFYENMYGMPYGGAPARNVNPWVHDNGDAMWYLFRNKQNVIVRGANMVEPEDKLEPRKPKPLPVTDAFAEKSYVRLAELDFPVKVCCLTHMHGAMLQQRIGNFAAFCDPALCMCALPSIVVSSSQPIDLCSVACTVAGQLVSRHLTGQCVAAQWCNLQAAGRCFRSCALGPFYRHECHQRWSQGLAVLEGSFQ